MRINGLLRNKKAKAICETSQTMLPEHLSKMALFWYQTRKKFQNVTILVPLRETPVVIIRKIRKENTKNPSLWAHQEKKTQSKVRTKKENARFQIVQSDKEKTNQDQTKYENRFQKVQSRKQLNLKLINEKTDLDQTIEEDLIQEALFKEVINIVISK